MSFQCLCVCTCLSVQINWIGLLVLHQDWQQFQPIITDFRSHKVECVLKPTNRCFVVDNLFKFSPSHFSTTFAIQQQSNRAMCRWLLCYWCRLQTNAMPMESGGAGGSLLFCSLLILIIISTDRYSLLSNSGQNLMTVVKWEGRGGPRRDRRAERFHWTSLMSFKEIHQ